MHRLAFVFVLIVIMIVFTTFIPVSTYTSHRHVCANNIEKHYTVQSGEVSEYFHDRTSLKKGRCSINNPDASSCPDCPPGRFGDGYVNIRLNIL
jgi:uncharacterized ion transporter superfamily protein YfcC